MRFTYKHIFAFVLLLLSSKAFSIDFSFNKLSKNELEFNVAFSAQEDKSKGVFPENIPVTPTENSEKEERENKENKDESFKNVFGISQSAQQNYITLINKCAIVINIRHAYCSHIYDLLHSWKAFLKITKHHTHCVFAKL